MRLLLVPSCGTCTQHHPARVVRRGGGCSCVGVLSGGTFGVDRLEAVWACGKPDMFNSNPRGAQFTWCCASP
ncbi:MAG TPA: hypothetical protein PLB25_06340 [Rhodoferax sp.]|nr:hypothetical protein [Rhodoferax sp.]